MKKLLMLAAVALCAATAWAQENVAQGKHVYMIGDALNTSITEDGMQILTDGSTSAEMNIWDSNTSQAQSFYIDLGTEYRLGTIAIMWEGACGSDYTVKTGTLGDDGTTITWGDAVVTESGLQGGSGYTQTKSYSIDATTRYLRFDCTAAYNSGWGVKLYEFYAYTWVAPQLGSCTISQDVFKYAESVSFTASPKDKTDADYTGDITYTVSPSTATVTASGTTVTLNAPSAGVYTVTASDGQGNSVDNVVGLIGTAADDPTDALNNVINMFCDTYSTSSEPGISDPSWNWKYSSREMLDFDGNRSYLVHKVGTYGLNASGVDITDYDTFHAAIYVAKDTKGYVLFEGPGTKIEFSLTGGQWNYLSLDVKDIATTVTWCQFYIGESSDDNNRSAAFDNVYFSKTGVADTEAPSLTKAEVKEVKSAQATITVNATDDIATEITYVLTDQNQKQYTATGTSGQDVDITLTGLSSATAYTLTVVAKDGNNNESASRTVTFTTNESTLPAIPEPTATVYKSIFSPYLGNTDGYYFADWGGGTGASITIEDKEGYQISSFQWFGSQFSNIDVTGYETLHLDVLPQQDMELTIVPITRNAADDANSPEKGIQFSIKADEWNAIELSVADLTQKGVNMANLFQIKYVSTVSTQGEDGVADGFGNGDGTQSFIVGNVYFYKSGSEEPGGVKPVISKFELSYLGSTMVRLAMNATDDAEGALTYTVSNVVAGTSQVTDKKREIASGEVASTSGNAGEDTEITISGLTPYKEYTLSLTATDADGNVSDAATLTFTTDPGTGGEGVTEDDIAGVKYRYEFSEINGIVTFYIVADGTGVTGFATQTHIQNYSYEATKDYYVDSSLKGSEITGGTEVAADSVSWQNLPEGTTINIVCWWAAAGGRANTDTLTYTTKGYFTGVTNGTIVAKPQASDIYSIDGRLVRANATSTEGLPRGIYIMGHKKVLVK